MRPRRLIFASRPTPNGPLHLGHIAGPYLRADVLRRASILKGWKVRAVSGLDSYQSYVALAAENTGSNPKSLVIQYGNDIRNAWCALKIYFDRLWDPSTGDASILQAAASRILSEFQRQDIVVNKLVDMPIFEVNRRDAYEAFLTGICASCGELTSANGCEACSVPTMPWEMREATLTLSGDTPQSSRRSVPMYQLAGQPGTPALRRRLGAMMHHDWQKKALNQIFSVGPKSIPVCYLNDWGLRLSQFSSGQILHTPLESAIILAIESRFLAETSSHLECANELVLLNGSDNIFNGVVLLSSVLDDIKLNRTAKDHFIVNPFYLLDGKKFSTSRQHAVWALDAEAEFGSDAIRLYLAKTAPESQTTNFSMREFAAFIETSLAGTWSEFIAPLTRSGKPKRRAGPMKMVIDDPVDSALLDRLWNALEPSHFSLRSAFAALDEFVAIGISGRGSDIAVERLLCFGTVVWPLAPELSEAIFKAAGYTFLPFASWDAAARFGDPVATDLRDPAPLERLLAKWKTLANR